MTEHEQPLTESTARGDHPVPDELHRWVARLVEEMHVDPAVVDVDGLLDLASAVAHRVVRPAVPVTAFVLGYAAGSSSGDRAHLELLLHQVRLLTRAWEEPGQEGR